jgi:hypothetical protein
VISLHRSRHSGPATVARFLSTDVDLSVAYIIYVKSASRHITLRLAWVSCSLFSLQLYVSFVVVRGDVSDRGR